MTRRGNSTQVYLNQADAVTTFRKWSLIATFRKEKSSFIKH